MQKTINQLRDELKENGKTITDARIRQIVISSLEENKDYVKIHSRLIMLNGNGVNKIKRKLKVL